MKKLLVLIVSALLAVTGVAATGCNGEKEILVVMRENGSGTREAFEKVVKNNEVSLDDITNEEGGDYAFVLNRQELPSTSQVITSVAASKNAIGYVSLASVGSTVKKIQVNGVDATTENVQSGDYAIQRPFLMLTRSDEVITAAAQDFLNFCMSEDAIEIIEGNGLIQDPDRTPGTYTPATVSAATTINVIGSTSMTEVMQKLIAAYNEVQPNVTVEQQYPGSGGGRTGVENDTTGNTIGLASSSSPNDAYVENTLCLDAVAVIVNPENEIENITIAQLFDIYTGAVKKFSELK